MRLLLAFLVAIVLFGILQGSAMAKRDPRLDQASQLYQKADYQGALTLVRQVQRQQPSDPTVHYMIGICQQRLGHAAEGKTELEWVARNSTDPQIRALAIKALPSAGSSSGSTSWTASAPAGYPPRNLVNDSVSQTIRTAAALGWRPCTGHKCLNINTPNWHKKHVDGHSDDEYWMTIKYDGGSYGLSTAHWGQIVDLHASGPYTGERIMCTVCGGTGWVRSR